jgi:hypothetical protein
MVSGYAPVDRSEAIFVLVNYSNNVTYPVKVKTIDNRDAGSIHLYTTSAKPDENLKMTIHSDGDEIISIPPRSVVTVVMSL